MGVRTDEFRGSRSGMNSEFWSQLRECDEYNAERAAYHQGQMVGDSARYAHHQEQARLYGNAARPRNTAADPPLKRNLEACIEKKPSGFKAFLKSLGCMC